METTKIDKKNVIKWNGRVLSIASIIFIGVKIYQLGFGIEKIENIPLFIAAVAVAVILKVLSVFASAFAWGKWVRYLTDQNIPYPKMIVVYGKANIGKYLPGNVMHYVERNLFAAQYGLSQKRIALATGAETIELLLSATLMVGLLLPRAYRQKVWALITARMNGFIYIIVLILVVLGIILLIRKGQKARRKENGTVAEPSNIVRTKGTLSTSLFTMAGYLITLTFLGAGMVILWMFCSSKLPTMEIAGLIIASFASAWVCGFIIPGASGGIGIREAILLLLLEGIASESVLLFIIVLHRLVTVVGDFLVYAGILLADREQNGTE